MTKPRALMADSSQKLAQDMCAQSGNEVVHKVISFANNDVPEYLQNLRRFQEKSRKVRIVVK